MSEIPNQPPEPAPVGAVSSTLRLRSIIVGALLFLQLPLAGAIIQTNALALPNQKVQARSALLVDVASGKVLFQRNPAEALPPASTVKLLTALLVYERTHLKGEVVIQRADTLVEPSHIPLRNGETVPVRTLVQSLLIGSDNDGAGPVHGRLGRKVCGDDERPRPPTGLHQQLVQNSQRPARAQPSDDRLRLVKDISGGDSGAGTARNLPNAQHHAPDGCRSPNAEESQ